MPVHLRHFSLRWIALGVAMGLVAVSAWAVQAATTTGSLEAETGAAAELTVSNATASGQQAIRFGTPSTDPGGGGAPAGELLWNGDFETGDFSQYMEADTRQEGSAEAPALVTDVVRQGKYAVKFVLNGSAGDVSRGELLPDQDIVGLFEEGEEYWFGHSTMIPAGPINTDRWQIIWNMHHAGRTGSVPVEMSQEGGQFQISGNESHPAGGQFWEKSLGAVKLGAWDDWQVRIKFSVNDGEVEVWRNGVNVLPAFKPVGGTLYPDAELFNYWKFGYYRAGDISEPGTIYYDNVKMGTTREIVGAR